MLTDRELERKVGVQPRLHLHLNFNNCYILASYLCSDQIRAASQIRAEALI